MTLTLDVVTVSKPSQRPYRLSDGGGLHLEISPNGGKYWRFKYRFNGRSNTVSCGVFPSVSIEEARARRDYFHVLLADGIDPSEHTRLEKAEQRIEAVRKTASTRFMLDNEGALSFQLGKRCLVLNTAETVELRAFLDATRAMSIKEPSCH